MPQYACTATIWTMVNGHALRYMRVIQPLKHARYKVELFRKVSNGIWIWKWALISLVLYLKGSAELSELCSGSALVLSPNGTIDTEHSEFSPKVQWLTVMLYTTTLPICIIKKILWDQCLVTCICFVGHKHCQKDYIFGRYEPLSGIAIRIVYPLLVRKKYHKMYTLIIRQAFGKNVLSHRYIWLSFVIVFVDFLYIYCCITLVHVSSSVLLSLIT